LANASFDAEQDAVENGFAGALQHRFRDQPQQGRLADLNVQGCGATEPIGIGLESGFQGQVEVFNHSQTFEFAVDSTHQHRVSLVNDLEGNDRLHVQLKDLEAGDHIAITPRLEWGQLTGIQKCSNQPIVLMQVIRKSIGITLNVEGEMLTGTEGQRHEHHLTHHDLIESAGFASMVSRIAFLGPAGTYGEQATRALIALESMPSPELVACTGLRAVVDHLAHGHCDAAVVPVENSVEGGVTATLDALWMHRDLCIRRALVLPIRHALLGDGPLAGITEVLSHPQALAQCSGWLAEHLPQALQLPTSSTAEAARMVRGSRFRAAIASQAAGAEHGLRELAFPINDVPGNCTRFLLLQRGDRSNRGDVASLAFSLHRNAPGALLEALACLARRGLNMSRIESRPSKRELGEYVFFIDVELSSAEDSSVALMELIDDLRPLCEHLAHFGAYPSSEGVRT
jgi:prephenate dehydratase